MREMVTADLDELALAHASPTFAELQPEQTVEDAIRCLRSQNLHDRILYLYVVDDERRLRGVVSTRHLLMADPAATIGSLMRSDVVTLPATATLRDAVDVFVAHRLLAVPIVGALGRLHGVVDVAAVGADGAAAVRRRYADELFEVLGLHVSETRRGGRTRDRLRALAWTIGGGAVAAVITAAHADLVRAVMALALFMPVALALSESIGMQAVALAIEQRGLRAGWGTLWRSARREIAVASGIAAACAALVAIFAGAWQRDLRLAGTVFVSVTVAMVVAAVVGAIAPVILRGFRRDPHVASGPAVLAIADFVTLIVYFRLATLFLG